MHPVSKGKSDIHFYCCVIFLSFCKHSRKGNPGRMAVTLFRKHQVRNICPICSFVFSTLGGTSLRVWEGIIRPNSQQPRKIFKESCRGFFNFSLLSVYWFFYPLPKLSLGRCYYRRNGWVFSFLESLVCWKKGQKGNGRQISLQYFLHNFTSLQSTRKDF